MYRVKFFLVWFTFDIMPGVVWLRFVVDGAVVSVGLLDDGLVQTRVNPNNESAEVFGRLKEQKDEDEIVQHRTRQQKTPHNRVRAVKWTVSRLCHTVVSSQTCQTI